MILNESQAKKTACPYMEGGCLGSHCMAWREVIKGSRSYTRTFETPLVGEEYQSALDGGATQIEILEDKIIWQEKVGRHKEGTGYCGLAGTPPELLGESKSSVQKSQENEDKVVKNDRGEEFDLSEIRRLSGQ